MSRAGRVSRALGAVVVTAALAATPLVAQQAAGSRWWSDVDRVDGFLRDGRWRAAARELGRLRPEVLRVSWREPDLGQVLSELAFQAAVVAANRGDREDALWEWHVAQAFERVARPARGGPRLVERDLTPYGRAAELLPAHPLRERGEAPAGEALPEATIVSDFEAAVAPEHTVLPLENVNSHRERMTNATFEVWVDREGRIRHPVVTSSWSPPILLQWGFDNLRVMKAFTPARLEGEPVGVLQDLELELGPASRF